MHALKELLHERIASGLKRKSITSCSKWAQQYRIMGQPFPGLFNFDHHPWCREMHDCEAELMVGMKGAQLGFTETALNKVFFNIDIHGKSVLYTLPASTPDAHDFSTSRFDPALESSRHLRTLFSDVKNIGHKRAGYANLFIRGSRSRSQLKSIPVGLAIFDEVDEMVQENIVLAFERMSGQKEKQSFLLSTPTIDHYGIHTYFLRSSQASFFFKCPSCRKHTQLTFPECIIITADDPNDQKIMDTHLVCKECHATLAHEDKPNWLQSGEWVEKYPDRMIKGYHVSQLYSMTVKPHELAAAYLNSMTNPTDEQEFWNSKLGRTHAVKGARITNVDIEACIGGYTMGEKGARNLLTTIGIDIGKKIHYEIDAWNINRRASNDINLASRPRLLKVGTVDEFDQLDSLISQYNVRAGVVDSQPERRLSRNLCLRYGGRIKMCFYGRGINSKNIHIHRDEEFAVSVDRTSWLDMSLGRFKGKKISLPKDLPQDYKDHIKALVRVYKKDADGNPVGQYVKGDNDPDHFAHARNYSEIALTIGVSQARSQDIGSVN